MKTAILINDKPIEIPANWDEVNYETFLKLRHAKTQIDVVIALTGLPPDVANQLSEPVIDALVKPCEFWIGDEPPTTTTQPIKVPNDIREMEFARRVNAEHRMKEQDDLYCVIILLAIYLTGTIDDEDIERKLVELNNQPCVAVLIAGNELMKQYLGIIDYESKIPKPIRKSDETRAGIKDLDKYGVFGFIDGLAGGDILKHDLIYKLPYETVMLKSNLNTEVANYQHRLREIMNK